MKVIILCGGMGTRLREETEYKPKPMVEIGGRPILWHIMKHYAHHGFNDFILALGYKGNIIREYFLNYFAYNSDITVDLGSGGKVRHHNDTIREDWKVTLVETGAETMTGYRVKSAARFIDGDNFMVTYGDAVSDTDLRSLYEFHLSHGLKGTVTGVFPPSRFGDLVTAGERVQMDIPFRLYMGDLPVGQWFALLAQPPAGLVVRLAVPGGARVHQSPCLVHFPFLQKSLSIESFRKNHIWSEKYHSFPRWSCCRFPTPDRSQQFLENFRPHKHFRSDRLRWIPLFRSPFPPPLWSICMSGLWLGRKKEGRRRKQEE